MADGLLGWQSDDRMNHTFAGKVWLILRRTTCNEWPNHCQIWSLQVVRRRVSHTFPANVWFIRSPWKKLWFHGGGNCPLAPPRKWRPWHFSAHYCDIQVSEIWCKNIQAFLRYSNFRVVWGYFILPHREHWTVNEGRLIKLSPRRIMGLFSSIALWITIGSTRSLQNLQITIYPPIPLTINHQT